MMNDNINDKLIEQRIRRNLTDAIKQSGMQQTVIAKNAYISDASLSDYMRKDKLPSLCTFVRLCRVMDISADDILGLKE